MGMRASSIIAEKSGISAVTDRRRVPQYLSQHFMRAEYRFTLSKKKSDSPEF